ncbi:MAG: helix-turn-helix transcriptional regulator [Candidatus Moraniibacteriota bacterium]
MEAKTISAKPSNNLKRIRTQKGISQGDISRKLDVHRAYISGIENDKRNPTLLNIEKIAKALGISAYELSK